MKQPKYFHFDLLIVHSQQLLRWNLYYFFYFWSWINYFYIEWKSGFIFLCLFNYIERKEELMWWKQTSRKINFSDFICRVIGENNLSSIWIDLDIRNLTPKIQVSNGRTHITDSIFSSNSAQIFDERESKKKKKKRKKILRKKK